MLAHPKETRSLYVMINLSSSSFALFFIGFFPIKSYLSKQGFARDPFSLPIEFQLFFLIGARPVGLPRLDSLSKTLLSILVTKLSQAYILYRSHILGVLNSIWGVSLRDSMGLITALCASRSERICKLPSVYVRAKILYCLSNGQILYLRRRINLLHGY